MVRINIVFSLLISLLVMLSCSDPGSNPNLGPGAITQTEVPDSLQIPPSGSFSKAVVKAWVEDPDGLKDVDSVYFYSQKPDGSLANSGSPLKMVDNGRAFNISNPWVNAGDEEAGDGIYSLTILMDITAQTGTYEFTFYMRDKKGNLSPSVTDSIEVYE